MKDKYLNILRTNNFIVSMTQLPDNTVKTPGVLSFFFWFSIFQVCSGGYFMLSLTGDREAEVVGTFSSASGCLGRLLQAFFKTISTPLRVWC